MAFSRGRRVWGLRRLASLTAVAAVAAAAVLTSTAAAGHGQAHKKRLTKINVIAASPFSLGQYYVLITMGQAKGFFAQHGLSVHFFAGTGSATSAQVVASGGADFGIGVGATAVISTVAQGAKIQMLGEDSPVAPIAVLSKAPGAITNPGELVGKTIGVPPGTTQAQIWPAFLDYNNISQTSVHSVNIPISSMQQALIHGQIDGYLSYASSNIPLLKSLGVAQPRAMLLSNFGFPIAPDEGIIARTATIQSKPTLVRNFVAAVEQTLEYAINHVAEAVKLGSKVDPTSFTPAVATAQSHYYAASIRAHAVSGKPYLWMDPFAWSSLLRTMKTYAGVSVSAPSVYYTNKFLPKKRGK